jgi:hypothetical protein
VLAEVRTRHGNAQFGVKLVKGRDEGGKGERRRT